MADYLKYVPLEITLTQKQEKDLFAEFAPVLTMLTAALVNVSKNQDFTRFAFLSKVLDLLLHEAYDSMVWPENASVGLPTTGRNH
jgi:hypothetical protein